MKKRLQGRRLSTTFIKALNSCDEWEIRGVKKRPGCERCNCRKKIKQYSPQRPRFLLRVHSETLLRLNQILDTENRSVTQAFCSRFDGVRFAVVEIEILGLIGFKNKLFEGS